MRVIKDEIGQPVHGNRGFSAARNTLYYDIKIKAEFGLYHSDPFE
jgi:hypothetical protein